MRGLSRSVAFGLDGDRLVSRSAQMCGFVTVQGAGEHQERLLLLRGKEIALRFDEGWPEDPEALNGVFNTERAEVWSGVTVAMSEPFTGLQMWLATALDGFCLMSVDVDLDTGLVAPQNKSACLSLLDGASLAYMTIRRNGDRAEFGAHGYGPDAKAVAQALVEEIRVWDRDHRRSEPMIYAYPATTPEASCPPVGSSPRGTAASSSPGPPRTRPTRAPPRRRRSDHDQADHHGHHQPEHRIQPGCARGRSRGTRREPSAQHRRQLRLDLLQRLHRVRVLRQRPLLTGPPRR
ncbi:hypothetical protein [Streptomyces goshikiensis]